METHELLETYLKSQFKYKDLTLNDYELNGSIIKLRYSYNPEYDWNMDMISYDNKLEIELLDYITWIHLKI